MNWDIDNWEFNPFKIVPTLWDAWTNGPVESTLQLTPYSYERAVELAEQGLIDPDGTPSVMGQAWIAEHPEEAPPYINNSDQLSGFRYPEDVPVYLQILNPQWTYNEVLKTEDELEGNGGGFPAWGWAGIGAGAALLAVIGIMAVAK